MKPALLLLACTAALPLACASGRAISSPADSGNRRDAFVFDATRHDAPDMTDALVSGDAFAPPIDAPMPPADTAACPGGTTRCGAVCVDPITDPAHCGACGTLCMLANATTVCSAGACGVGACNSGFANCNGMASDGCERAVSCVSGAVCMTACGSSGTTDCADVCAPRCTAPAERCNLVDDDCDGACDNVGGCRVGVHRSSNASGHFYTTNRSEAACCGFTVEVFDYYFLMTASAAGTAPLYRCLQPSTGRHLYTTRADCEGLRSEGVMGHVATGPSCGAIPLYRLRNTAGNNLYTTMSSERTSAMGAGYTYVGITGYVWTR